MKALQDHLIGTSSGTWPLIEWLAELKRQHRPVFGEGEQLSWAKKIAEVDCTKSRKLLLALMAEAENHHERIEELHREFDTLAAAINKIDRNNP